MIKGIFVTGTDTGVGKTWISGAIAAVLRNHEFDVGVWKPVQSGCSVGDLEADSFQLKSVSGVKDPESVISPYTFNAPLAPYVAAAPENREVSIEQLCRSGEEVIRRHEFTIVEGVGGLAVPLNNQKMVADLAVKLNLPLIIVSRPSLGTINHTLLTLHYARAYALNILGIIFNGYEKEVPSEIHSIDEISPEDSQICERSNPFVINRFAKAPILGMVPRVSEDSDLKERRRVVNCHVQINKIIECLIQQRK